MRPFRILLIAGLILLLVSVFISSEKLNIQLKDTWYILPLDFLARVLGLIVIVLGFIYRKSNLRLAFPKLAFVHITTTIVLAYLLIVLVFWADNYQNVRPTRYTDYSSWETFGRLAYGRLIPVLWTFAFVLTQGFFVLMLIFGHKRENKL